MSQSVDSTSPIPHGNLLALSSEHEPMEYPSDNICALEKNKKWYINTGVTTASIKNAAITFKGLLSITEWYQVVAEMKIKKHNSRLFSVYFINISPHEPLPYFWVIIFHNKRFCRNKKKKPFYEL